MKSSLHHITEEEFRVMQKRVRGGVVGTASPSKGVRRRDECTHALISAAGSNPAPSPYKSNLERAFAQKLELERRAGLWTSVQYEPLSFRLPGKKNFFKPDFLVCNYNGYLTFFEVKGFNRSDDRSLVKMKTAAGLNPWAKFALVKRVKGEWTERVIA